MRIIAGKVKGRKLVSLKGNHIRPTLDRIKEAFFNQVQPDLEDASFLDSFSGTGNIGLEAWSRGAAKIILVESDPRACEIIQKNIKICDAMTEVEILKADAVNGLYQLEKRKIRFDLVYIDPPFFSELYEDYLTALAQSTLLKDTSVIVVEHFHKVVLRENYININRYRKRKYGDTCLSFYMREPILT